MLIILHQSYKNKKASSNCTLKFCFYAIKVFTEFYVKPKEWNAFYGLQVPAEDFLYMTRILYTAPSDHKWGEREVDYVLVIQKDVELNPNPNEVKECLYVGRDDLKGFLGKHASKGLEF